MKKFEEHKLTVRSVDHDCMTNSEQKKELLDFWLFSRLYLLYQVVVVEEELSICVRIPAEINLLLKNRGRESELAQVPHLSMDPWR